MATHDEPTALTHRDRSPPPLLLDNGGQQLYLVGAVPVGVGRIGLKSPRIGYRGMSAKDSHLVVSAVSTLTAPLRLSRSYLMTKITRKRFAKVLKEYRERRRFTQEEAATKLGVSLRTLQNWEIARNMPRGFGLTALLKVISPK